MFREFLKRQSNVFYIQLWPDLIKVTELNSSQVYEDAPLVAFDSGDEKHTILEIGESARSLSGKPNVAVIGPLYSDGYVFADIDCVVAIINHAIFSMSKRAPGKIFSPLIIIHPMRDAERGLCVGDADVAKLLSKRCGARTTLLMEPDEYLDLDGVA